MRPPLRCNLRDPMVLEPELFAQQGTLLVELVVLNGESHPRIINAIGGPGTRKDIGVVRQRKGMEHRGFHTALPAFG